MSLQPSDDVYVPSKSVLVYPETRQDVRANGEGVSQVVFHLAPHLQFINPENTRLRYEVVMEGRGQPVPSDVCGVHAFWRHQRVQTADGLNMLEEVDEMASRVAMEWSYNSDETINNSRTLEQGLVLTSSNQNITFWNSQNTPTETITAGAVAKTIQINQEIYSGILGKQADQVCPISGMGGLNLTLQTHNLKKCIQIKNKGGKNDSNVGLVAKAVVVGDWNNASVNHAVDVEIKNGAVDGNTNPFVVGDKVYHDVAGVDTELGLVKSVKVANGNCAIEITANIAVSTDGPALAIDDKIYVVQDDRFRGWTASNANYGNDAQTVIAKAQALVKVNYTLKNLEMNVELVMPAKSYVDRMTKAMMSGGFMMNFKQVNNYRVNVVGTQGNLNVSIPVGSEARRAYSLFVMPLNTIDTFDGNNLTCVGADDAVNYQFVINNQVIPDQLCRLEKLSLTPSRINQLALSETRKGFVNIQVAVRNLQRPENNFVIARALSAFGHTSNISENDVSLRIEYGSNATRQKTMNCYLCSQRTLVIRNDGMEVM